MGWNLQKGIIIAATRIIGGQGIIHVIMNYCIFITITITILFIPILL
jgi:hypothetical protein